MRTSKSFSVLFWVKQQTSESEGLIYARITVDQKRVNVSLKRKVPLALWDHRAKRLAGTSAKVRHINQYIDRCQAQFYDCYQELKSQHKLITAKLIKSSFLGGVIFPSIDLTGPLGIFLMQSLIILTLSLISSILQR